MLNAALLVLTHLLILGAAERTPRLKFTLRGLPHVEFVSLQKYTVQFHDQRSETLYIGLTGSVVFASFGQFNVSQTLIPLPLDDNTKDSCKSKGPPTPDFCENVITVIQRLNSSTIIICGTHAGSPACWFLHNNGTELANDKEGHGIMRDGKGISPPSPIHRPISITVEGDLYSAITGSSLSTGVIQRCYGRLKQMKTEDKWLLNPRFVGSAWIKLKDSSKDEIYFFFTETDNNVALDGEPHRSRIGRVCKIDEGASRAPVDTWTTFLKARLICGFPTQSRHFNKIEDAFVLLSEDDPRNSVVYGIFSSLWNSTAICAYSQADIDRAFKTSRLKGFTGNLPGNQRPGTCTTSIVPKNILTIIKNFPEIEDPIYPIKEQPLYVMKHSSYTRITVDRVKGANQKLYHVLFLGTGNGKIHKVLYSNGKSFIISELSPFKTEAPISAMTLDSSMGQMFVGTPLETVRLPLANCEGYGSTCKQCVAARDPYCGWDRANEKCAPISHALNSNDSEILQNVEQLNVSICDGTSDIVAFDEQPKELTIKSGAYLYLPCPVKSYHAVYTWSYNQKDQFTCTIKDGSCPLMLNGEVPISEGLFKCTASEDGLKEELAVYKVRLNGGNAPALESMTFAFGLAVTFALM
ncbi:semaphorin-7A [Heterodontus francisci]|uniref:semaphorin-7A n=1 Tax=Heterodontus francisci TaxID=7792 RepID=UPI00355AD1FD